MTYWMYGVGFFLFVCIIGALKADHQTRVLFTAGIIAALAFLATKRKR
jgi:hypothetical protein